ncbi:hypothetical protein E2C01_056330 [Portunus trituberculatus]|uniref:Uncharacterized protein n=1 Tax=Portunus trituberculatus TaxID=210409 RepID=A0A5B7GYV4_PORTR|nr:hypothetical protein [Portunus trituberculatus]
MLWVFSSVDALVVYACFPEDNIYSRLFVRPSVGERGGLWAADGGPRGGVGLGWGALLKPSNARRRRLSGARSMVE